MAVLSAYRIDLLRCIVPAIAEACFGSTVSQPDASFARQKSLTYLTESLQRRERRMCASKKHRLLGLLPTEWLKTDIVGRQLRPTGYPIWHCNVLG